MEAFEAWRRGNGMENQYLKPPRPSRDRGLIMNRITSREHGKERQVSSLLRKILVPLRFFAERRQRFILVF